ncbi:hypothetical protein [Priestia megaterium]|uniref:hypothetical protein n=1 Tax=Priestia megaterium TaxID=1404 RepID=UPI0035B5DF7B
MSIKNLKILDKVGVADLPSWINFAFELGTYINDYGIRHKKVTSILLSLPSEQFFSLLIVMGIADKRFSTNKQMRSIRKTVLSLQKGSRIIYQDEQSSRKASVISVEPSPVFENEMILKIKDGKIERGIPERQWMERVILINEEVDEIKRTRKVSKKQQVGLDSSDLLRMLYPSSQLNKIAFYPGDLFYLIGNIAQIKDSMSEKIFYSNGCQGSIGDFLYLDNTNSYTNGKLFSSQMKKIEVEINEKLPVIYSGINSYMKQAKYFSKNPRIIVTSRSDNENRIDEIKQELKREFLQGEYKIVTEEFIDYLKSTNTQIPTGIEFLAWR